MTFQGTFEKRCLTSGAPTELSFLTSSLSILFVLTNIPGNLLVILAVVIDPNKNLQSPFNWLIANLAMADLTVGAITDSLSIHLHLREGLDLKTNSEEIKVLHVTYFISCTASVLSLSTLAIERYLAIQKPHTYRNKFTGKRISLTVAGIWLFSLGLPQVYFEVGYITYAFIFANTSIVVAILITCFTYSLMLYKVKERSQNIANGSNETAASHPARFTASSTTATGGSSNFDSPNTALKNTQLMERKITKMFIVVLIVLLCCYGPSTTLIYIMNFCESCSCSTLHWFRDIQFVFVIMNSSVNFYCYALRSPRFRNAFSKILKLNSRREEPDFFNINATQRYPKNSIEMSDGFASRYLNSRGILKGQSNLGLQIK